MDQKSFTCTIAPWLSVGSGKKAIEFYKDAFGANEVYHLDGPDDTVVSRLSVNGAEFWLSDDPRAKPPFNSYIRLILTVKDPDTVFESALTAGATKVYDVAEEHGWRIGRMIDPFGHHWEIGCQTDS